jgi:glycosyltransferase involved in cell wall biosynthesis
MPDPMTVLFVTAMYPHAANPASGSFVAQQAEAVRRLGHRVDVLHVLGYRSRWNYLWGNLRLAARVRRTTYDLIHVHYGLTGLSALWRRGVPMVVTIHGSDALVGRLQPAISRFVCRRAAAVIAVTEQIASKIPGRVIPCGVDLERFRPLDRTESRSRLGLDPGRRLVLFPFDPARRVKRHDLANAAVGDLASRGHDVELRVVTGRPQRQMPLWYSAADALIVASDSEGSPVAVKEALACELPVVSTRVGDVEEIARGVAAFALCDREPAALADGIERVWDLPRNERGGRAAAERYDLRRLTEELVEVYEEVRRGSAG